MFFIAFKDILAKHRQKYQQQKQQQNGSGGSSRGNSPPQSQQAAQKMPTSLASELAESGFFAEPYGNGNVADFYSAPGEVLFCGGLRDAFCFCKDFSTFSRLLTFPILLALCLIRQ